jgi:hypothetical protein
MIENNDIHLFLENQEDQWTNGKDPGYGKHKTG